jgi:hypothetical protein
MNVHCSEICIRSDNKYRHGQRLFVWLLLVMVIRAKSQGSGCTAAIKTPVALQPLGLFYTLFSRSSHCRRQMSPRPTRRERSEQREVELLMGEKE